jgi:hypothetical protein
MSFILNLVATYGLPMPTYKKGTTLHQLLACLAFEIYLRAACTIFAVADNVKNNETRGYCII